MKKLAILAIVAMFSVACSKTEAPQTTTPVDSTTQTTDTTCVVDTTVAPVDTAVAVQ